MRLVTTGLPDAEGMLRAALEIDLAQGWKTYWRDPGDAGVPPSVDVSASSNVESATLGLPPPVRVDDGTTRWAGYKHPVTFAVTLQTQPGSAAATLVTADIFLGLCETICVPLQARLELDPYADAGNAADAVIVQAAFDALPSPAQPDFGVTPLAGSDAEMLLEATFPAGAEGDLFLATPPGYVLATPERKDAGGKVVFSVAVIDRPKEKPQGVTIPYTLVTSAGSVAGELPLP